MSDLGSGFGLGRLWSVLEIFEFRAQPFYTAVSSIRQLRSSIENGLKSFHPQQDGSVTIEHIDDPVILSFLKETAAKLALACRTMGAQVTLLVVVELDEHLDSGMVTFEGLGKFAEDIDTTLKRELKLVKLLALEAHDRDLYAPKEPLFGQTFEDRFQSARFDVIEAAKCLALERSTASAYHSLRTLEAAILALSRCLGIPDPIKGADRSWGKMLGFIDDELEKRWPAKFARMSGDAQTFDEIYGALAGMQNPYRNSTMHLADKYTQEEARHIFELVKGLMRRVADRMDETGLPLA